jgi:hypothetical protein
LVLCVCVNLQLSSADQEASACSSRGV